MNARMGSLLLLVSTMTSGAVAGLACGPATNEPPAEVPKASLPPDRTEVTMEVSSAKPIPEAPPASPPPAASSPPGASKGASAPPANPAPTAAVATTTGKESAEDPTVGGVQSDPAVEKAVAPVRPRLRACYSKAQAAEPNVTGSATFDATLGKDGHVVSARFVKREGLNEDMVGCLLSAMKTMAFDAGRKTQVVTLSFGASASPPASSPAAKH